MIPLIQNDYYKYHSMFRGNHVKGVTYFKSLLNTPETRAQITSSVPALAAVFTDFSKSEATRLCFDVLKNKTYFQTAALTYLRGVGETNYESLNDLYNDTNNMFRLFRNSEYNQIIDQSSLLLNSLKKQNTLRELAKSQNTDIVLNKTRLDALNSCVSYATINTSSSFTNYWNTLNNQTTDFAELEKYYGKETNEAWAIIDDEEEVMYMPTRIKTRYNSSSTYYYYPAVFKYDIKSSTWSLFHISDTEVKQTSTSNNSRIVNALCFDKTNKHLYIFYKAVYNNTSVYCDIVDTITKTPLVTKRLLANVGGTGFQEPYYCIFDETIGAAKYAWSVGEMNVSTSTSYGWIYGATVNANEVVWSGKVCHPLAETTMYSSYYYIISAANRQKMRSKHGVIVGVVQAGSDTSSTVCTFAIIKSQGDKLVSKYVNTPVNCQYSQIYDIDGCAVLSDGVVAMKWDSIKWNGTSGRYVAMMIDTGITTPKVIYHNYITSQYSIYPCYYLNKYLIREGAESTSYIVCGKNSSNTMSQCSYSTGLTNMFNLGALQYKCSDRYLTNGAWVIYDIERGLRRWS